MQSELDIARDVASRLERAGIAYMITGSMAMNVYAQPRMTRDVDIVIELGMADVQTVVDLFADAYYVSESAVVEAIRQRTMFNIIHTQGVVKVDFVIRKQEPYRELEFQRRVRLPVDGFVAWVVSKEDLILSKLVWSKDSRSEVQARDLKNLLGTGYDEKYVNEWAAQLGVSDRLEELAS